MVRRISPKVSAVALAGILGLAIISGSSPSDNVKDGQNAAMFGPVGNGADETAELKLGSSKRCDSLDPGLSFDAWCAVIHRTYSRNVMAFNGSAGLAGLEVVPDLASANPEISQDAKVWTFKLREDVRWDDGTFVTVGDVRYSIERLYAKTLQASVPNRILCLLSNCGDGTPDYQGPFKKKYPHLKSIKTSGKFKISFELTRSCGDFDRVLASSQFAPIQRTRDIELRREKLSYANNPASNGPFKLSLQETPLVAKFVRNPFWLQQSDPIRSPKVKLMTWRVYGTDVAVDHALVKGAIDLKLNSGLGIASRSFVLNSPKHKKQVDLVPSNSTNIFALAPSVPPLDNVSCREAIFYALNKKDLQKMRGGTSVSSIAHSLIPRGVPGYAPEQNNFPSGAQDEGNLITARQKLSECGYPDGFEVGMGYLDLGVGRNIYLSVQRSLARVGIVIDPVRFTNFADYFTLGIGSPEYIKERNIGIMMTNLGPEYLSANAFWSPVVDGRYITNYSNRNLAELSDDEVDALVDKLSVIADYQTLASLSSQLQNNIEARAVYLPYATDQIVLFRSSKLVSVYVQQGLGSSYDLVNVGKNNSAF